MRQLAQPEEMEGAGPLGGCGEADALGQRSLSMPAATWQGARTAAASLARKAGTTILATLLASVREPDAARMRSRMRRIARLCQAALFLIASKLGI